MTLQQLKYIVAIDGYRHFGKAAEACGLTQSTLSLMVKKLEEELDVRIFDRDARPVEATAIGRRVIDRAKVVLYNVDQISEMILTEKSSVSGPLRLGLISTVAPVLVAGLFKYVGNKYPAVSFQTEEMLTHTIKDKLRKAEIDMGILSGPVDDPDLLEIPLYHERFYAYISPDSPLHSLQEIRADHLFDQPVWIIKDGVRLVDREGLDRSERITYERLFEGGRVGTLIQVVNEIGGLTIIPETHVGLILYSFHDNLRPIVGPPPTRTISLVIRNDYIHESKLNLVVDAVKSIIPGALLDPVVRKGRLEL